MIVNLFAIGKIRGLRSPCSTALAIVFALFLIPLPVFSQPPLQTARVISPELEQEFRYLEAEALAYKVVSATRSEKPMDQVPENITVITAQEIKALNAHTLTDVLNHVPGIQMDIRGGPGAITTASIQGSSIAHVLVMVDGVSLNTLGSFAVNTSSIPVKNIQRVEIIKGPASSAWGSSLGGVINIITKGGDSREKFEGALSTSYGEADTVDSHAEASGRLPNMDYYLNYNKVRTNGLTANPPHDTDHFYGKLKLDLTEKSYFLFSLGYIGADTGEGEWTDWDLFTHKYFSQIYSTMEFGVKPREDMDFTFSLRGRQMDEEAVDFLISTGEEYFRTTNKDLEYGASGKFSWTKGPHHLVMGMDYNHGQLDSNAFTEGSSHLLKRWAAFVNDTFSWRDFTLVPGFRYDHSNTNGGFMSPSMGITYKPREGILFRSYVARGFNIPSLFETFGTGGFYIANPSLTMEKIRSYQVGMETTLIPYVWLKTGLFRHEISDALAGQTVSEDPPLWTKVNKSKQRRQGFEIEAWTEPVYHTSLTAGYVFTDVKDLETNTYIEASPRYTVDIGVHYRNPDILEALLKGHFIWWNPFTDIGHDFNSFIWDLHLSREVKSGEWGRMELFLSAHNLFNSSQYLVDILKNPGRWVEGGVRVNF